MNYIKFKDIFKNNTLISKKEILLNFPNFDNKKSDPDLSEPPLPCHLVTVSPKPTPVGPQQAAYKPAGGSIDR